MRQLQPAALDLRAMLRAGFEARGESAWHQEPGPGGRWSWHASALSGCARQQILRRAGIEQEEPRIESLMTFEVGHQMHRLLQECAAVWDGAEVVGSEIGGHHPQLPLAARADLILRTAEGVQILDVKTESSFAGKHRREEANGGSAARAEHALQLAATALVVEATGVAPGIGPGALGSGWIVYVNKETGGLDQQPVEIDGALRGRVTDRLAELDRAWAAYEQFGVLPPMLPEDRPGRCHWNCRPRSDADRRGLYCGWRLVCHQRERLPE